MNFLRWFQWIMTKLLKRYLLMIKNKKWTGHLIFIFFIEQRNPADG